MFWTRSCLAPCPAVNPPEHRDKDGCPAPHGDGLEAFTDDRERCIAAAACDYSGEGHPEQAFADDQASRGKHTHSFSGFGVFARVGPFFIIMAEHDAGSENNASE